MKYAEAIEAAKEALAFDPFNEEIWRAIETWESRLALLNDDPEQAGPRSSPYNDPARS